MKTYICYKANGEKVTYQDGSKTYVAGYVVKQLKDIKKLMTLDIYERTDYVQELKYDKATTTNEDGTTNHNMNEWKYADCKKWYIHRIWNLETE